MDMAYFNRGNTHGGSRGFEDFDKAIKINPSNAFTYNGRGIYYYFRRNYDRVIEEFGEALKVNPSYSIAYINRGSAFASIGEYFRAERDFKEAKRLGPYNELVHTNLELASECLQSTRDLKADAEAIRGTVWHIRRHI